MLSKKLQLLTFQKTIPKIEENQKEIQLTQLSGEVKLTIGTTILSCPVCVKNV